jgi:hypothetical protein
VLRKIIRQARERDEKRAAKKWADQIGRW